jgi:hypothetical protein
LPHKVETFVFHICQAFLSCKHEATTCSRIFYFACGTLNIS